METKRLSISSLSSLWEESWGEKLPSGRLPAGETQLGFYPINTFNVALDEEGRPISYRGWSETKGYFMVGMSFTKDEWRGKGVFKSIAPPMNGKVILALSQRAKDFAPEAWIENYRSKGFTINPTPEQVVEIFGETTATTEAFTEYYSNKNGKAWAIKNMGQKVTKQKRYTISIGKKGYDVVDNKTSQPVNRTGLSRSRAKAMLAAIENGETDLTQYETKVKRKATSQNWRTILRKRFKR